jgi:hypothetical protein
MTDRIRIIPHDGMSNAARRAAAQFRVGDRIRLSKLG